MKLATSYRSILIVGGLAAFMVGAWLLGPSFTLPEDEYVDLPSDISPLVLDSASLRAPDEGIVPQNGGRTQVAQPPLPPEEPPLSPTEVQKANQTLRSAIVNIFCIADQESFVGSVSGSGVLIDPRGTILTNAHVAQRLLLKDYPKKDSIECTARTGSPAEDAYTVELAYISPKWIFTHRNIITEEMGRGTGEDDFALIRVTGSATEEELTLPFPFVETALREVLDAEYVVAAGYPAGGSNEEILNELDMISAFVPIQNIYTFERNTADLIGLGGTQIAEQGVSGGGVANTDGELLGILVTSSLEDNINDRSVHAITLGHILRSFNAQHKRSFAEYLAGLHDGENFFEEISPALTTALLDALGEL